MRHTRNLLVAVLAVVAAFPAVTRAETALFTYSWHFGNMPAKFYFSTSGQGPVDINTNISPSFDTFIVEHAKGTATFSLPANGTGSAEVNVPDPNQIYHIPFGTFSGTGLLGGNGPELSNFTAQIPVNLTITDLASNETKVVPGNFNAELVGGLGANFTAYSGRADFPITTVSVGGRDYTFTPLANDAIFYTDPAGGGSPLTLGLQVAISSAGGGILTPSEAVPEPSSLLLGIGAAATCGIAAYRKRRRAIQV